LKKNEEKFNAMLSAIGDHMSMMDRDLNIIWTNEIAKNMFGDDLVGRKCYEVYHNRKMPCEPHPCITLKAFKDGKVHSHETEVIDKNGHTLNFHCTANVALKDDHGNPETVIEISRDITQRKKLEAQLRQAQKMEAIGTLAEGIAHDFNNILGIILGNTELALSTLENVPEWNPLSGWLEEIKTASMRAKDVVGRILACAGVVEAKTKPINICPVVEESIKRLRRMLPPSIKIKQAFSIGHDVVLADPIQIHQVMTSLCSNAYHAMAETGGIIEISLENVIVDASSIESCQTLSPGGYVTLTIADSGPGIDQKAIDRIFDPYYTTKEAGIGVGLGLSVVHGIVEKMGGDISVLSDPGKGTRFMIFIPVAEAEVTVCETNKITYPVNGTERILFIDDEEAIAQLGKEMLELFGYQVDACVSPLEALALFKENPDKFDLVITDMIMPMMTGDRLTAELIKIRPDIPVVLCSGNIHLFDKEPAVKKGIKAFMAKPVHMNELGQKIREVLDGGAGV